MGHKTLELSRNGKVWGVTQCIHVGPYSETHYLEINKGGFCSNHCHKYKWNRFYIINGILQVTMYKENGEDVTVLEKGMATDVPPGIFHRFKCLEDCRCLEVYWIDDLNPFDIDRKDDGGISS